MRFSIREKIFIVILLPSLFLLFLICLDYRNLQVLGRSAELILANNYQSIKAAQQIRQQIEAGRNEVLLAFFQKKAVELDHFDNSKKIETLLAICRAHIFEAGEQQIVDSLADGHAEYQQVLARVAAGPSRETSDPNFQHLISLADRLLSDIDRLVAVNEQGMEKADEMTRELAGRSLRYAITLLLGALLSTLVLSFILSARISRPLVSLAHLLAEVREGSGEYPRIPVTTADEIGFLSAEFNRLFEHLKDYDRLSAEQLLAEQQKTHGLELGKTRFIADLSHQLKTPMTSLAMSLGLLTESAPRLSAEKKTKLLDTAKEDCARLTVLINELVDMARLDSMMKPRRMELADLDRVIAECTRPLQLQAEEKGVRLEVDIRGPIPPLFIDSFRFPWVVTNLVANAIRHTETGGQVRIMAHCQGQRCYVECADTGVGIEAKNLARIFERYTQFSVPEKVGASGLGLAIVKDIIDQHGGEITVESEVNRGTTFTLWVPLSQENTNG